MPIFNKQMTRHLNYISIGDLEKIIDELEGHKVSMDKLITLYKEELKRRGVVLDEKA